MTKLNFTGRRRIDNDRVTLRVSGGPDDLRLSADRFDLAGLGLPANARVVVEAQLQTNYMRFDCGRVADVVHLDAVPLTDFDTAEGILFRLKVIGDDDGDRGKLLAVADRIKASVRGRSGDTASEGQAGREPILPLQPRDLDQVVWMVDTSGDRPVLQVNRNLPDWKGFVQRPEFRALVFPAVLRQIALWVVQEDVEDATPDDAAWPWMLFLERLGHPPQDVDEEKYEEWADEVGHAFARQAGLFDALLATTEAGERDR